MNMRTAAGTFKKTGNKYLVLSQNNTADRAYSLTISAQAVDAAPYMHEPISAPVQ